MPTKVTKPIEDYINETVKKEISDISKNIVDSLYKKSDEGRKNELLTGMTKALEYLANRIDHGAVFEVRIKEPKPPEAVQKESDKRTTEEKKLIKKYEEEKKTNEQINITGTSMKSLPSIEKPILSLPYNNKQENTDDNN